MCYLIICEPKTALNKVLFFLKVGNLDILVKNLKIINVSYGSIFLKICNIEQVKTHTYLLITNLLLLSMCISPFEPTIKSIDKNLWNLGLLRNP